LQSWGLVRPVQTLGERRQQFESVKDVWEMFRVILDQRKKREVDPTLQVLRDCITELDGKDAENTYARERLRELEDFFSGVDTIYSELRQLPPGALRRFLKARGLIRKLLPAK
jgi:DNA-binding transcriptional regulator GbsR (MarR family)